MVTSTYANRGYDANVFNLKSLTCSFGIGNILCEGEPIPSSTNCPFGQSSFIVTLLIERKSPFNDKNCILNGILALKMPF